MPDLDQDDPQRQSIDPSSATPVTVSAEPAEPNECSPSAMTEEEHRAQLEQLAAARVQQQQENADDKPLENDPVGNAIPGIMAAPVIGIGEAVVTGVEEGVMGGVAREVGTEGVKTIAELGEEKSEESEREWERANAGAGGAPQQ